MARQKLTLELEFPDTTIVERLMEVLGDALYKSDISELAPMPEEFYEGSTEWDYDNIQARWKIENL